ADRRSDAGRARPHRPGQGDDGDPEGRAEVTLMRHSPLAPLAGRGWLSEVKPGEGRHSAGCLQDGAPHPPLRGTLSPRAGRRLVVAAAALLLLAATAFAQVGEKITVNVIEVPVTVVDRDGNAV